MFPRHYYPGHYFAPHYFPGEADVLPWRTRSKAPFFEREAEVDSRPHWGPHLFAFVQPAVVDYIPWMKRPRGDFFDPAKQPDGEILWNPSMSPDRFQVGTNAPMIRRTPTEGRRLGRDAEILSSAFNSLTLQGILRMLDVSYWGVSPMRITDAAAEPNTVYYSTDQKVLAYKDRGGTVWPLY